MPTHDEIVNRAVAAVKQADKSAIVRAFVGSLSTRNLPARSAFGSYMVLQMFEAHPYAKSREFSDDECWYCSLRKSSNFAETSKRVRDYPFQVQHSRVNYSCFDLETFANRKVDEPTAEDRQILRDLLDAIRALPVTAQLTELGKCLSPVLKSNKHERMILLETLGYAGILLPKGKLHYGKQFVSYDAAESDQPSEYFKREWAYPVRFWTGADGLNEKVVKSIFGKHLQP